MFDTQADSWADQTDLRYLLVSLSLETSFISAVLRLYGCSFHLPVATERNFVGGNFKQCLKSDHVSNNKVLKNNLN
jgi:hypothetical protein